MSLQTFFDNFAQLADAPNGVQKLRELILQLAVEGKLVSQNPNDESASDLHERIKLKKKQLFSERRTNQNEKLSTITKDEVAYKLPQNWKWVRLGEIQIFTNGFAFKSSDYQSDGVGIVRIGDIQNGKISTEGMRFVSTNFLNTLESKFQIKKGDLLIAMSGATTGKLGFNKTADIFLLNQRVGKIEFIEISPVYGFLFLKTKVAENLNSSAGSAIPNLSTEQINNIPFPLPPLEEQKRIVAKVDELMRLCDELEAKQKKRRESRVRLNNAMLAPLNNAASLAPEEFEQSLQRLSENFDALYESAETVGKLRSTILQLAVQGKLATQDEKDEPASVLLEKIKKEKERLINEKKIRKSDGLPSIENNETSFELPKNWNWCRLGEFGFTQTGTTPSTSKHEFYGNDFPFIKPADISNNGINYNNEGLSKLGINAGRYVPANSVMMVSIGGSIGKVGIVDRVSCTPKSRQILADFKVEFRG